MALALFCLPAPAAELAGHRHHALPQDESFTLAEAIESAMAAYPETILLDARAQQANAWIERGNSWIADRPSLSLRYENDGLGSDTGFDEYQTGLQLPLWNFGARAAVKSFGNALSSEASAAAAALRWEVAGIVRAALWNVALAENDQKLAEQALETAGRLASIVERRHELGDVAMADVLLARSSYLQFQTALTEANATLLDAERAFRSATGLDRRPAFLAEVLSDSDQILPQHPALVLANAALASAEADVDVAQETANTRSSILIGTRHERPARGAGFDDMFAVTLTVPFGGRSHRRTEISSAARAAAEARARRNFRLRELTLAMHEAAHGLNVVHENLGSATQRLELAQRHQAMGESAYEKGELELIDLLKIQATAIEARRQAQRLMIDEKRQAALYNQAVGELP